MSYNQTRCNTYIIVLEGKGGVRTPRTPPLDLALKSLMLRTALQLLILPASTKPEVLDAILKYVLLYFLKMVVQVHKLRQLLD